ncbi:MAG: DNA polymerase IV [Erysipelotrichaceae bacterium]|nr:DNA polymerase IV [Erysipelotrichaceae bacterium]
MSIIYHIDLNAFFATAETTKDPSLADKPVAVGGSGRKGIISTANYIARKYGVHSAMPVFEAMKLCPELIVIPGDYELYERLSAKFINLIREYSSKVEQASIDECYADMEEAITNFYKPLDLAVEIQRRVKEELGLTCSIGIAPNKFLAKIASDLKKPNGITVLRKKEIRSKLWPLSIDAMGGIGKKTSPYLKQAGIYTIGDMADPNNRTIIEKYLGKNTDTYINYANGIDDSPVTTYHEVKSMSQSTTLEENILDFADVKVIFSKLTKRLCDRLTEENLYGNTVTITVRFYNFKNITRSRKLEHDTNSYEEILASALMLFEENDQNEPIRHLGIALGNIKSIQNDHNIDLFTMDEEPNAIETLKNEINSKLQHSEVILASDLVTKKKSKFHGIFKH